MHSQLPQTIRRFPLLLGAAFLALTTACDALGPGGGDDDDGVSILDAIPAGSLVITEVQAEPNVGRPEFIEVLNTSDATVDLVGCQFVDGGTAPHDFTIYDSVVVEGGAYVLFGGGEYLGTNEGEVPIQVDWHSVITLNQGDPEESFGLFCPDGVGTRHAIDEVTFDWDVLGIRKGHAWQLFSDTDATTNDDASNWCEAPSSEAATYAIVDGQPDYGSPGAEAVCDEAMGATPSQPGDIVISEILVKNFDGLKEWVELTNPSTQAFDLRGCVLADQAVGAVPANEHTFDNELGTTVISAGQTLLLSKTDTALTSDGAVVSNYPYTSLTFNDSGDESLKLSCAKGTSLVTIDEIIYNWESFGDAYRGYSLSLSGNSVDAESNDDMASWCLATEDNAYFTTTITDDDGDSETYTAYGTPGTLNPDCPALQPYPETGDLVITEIMVHSSSSLGADEEWFEVYNTSAAAVRLDGCTIENRNQGDSSGSEEVISAGATISVEAGTYAVLAKSSASESMNCSIPYLATYSGISFNNNSPKALSVICPGASGDTIIDTVEYDGGFSAGYSWQLRQGMEDSSSNDSPAAWCSDTTTNPASYPWSCPTDDPTNFGSPGQASTCS